MRKETLLFVALIMMPLIMHAQERKTVEVEVNISELAWLLIDDFPQYKDKKDVRDYIRTRLYNSVKEKGYSMILVKGIVFDCEKKIPGRDAYVFTSYKQKDGGPVILTSVMGMPKAGQTVKVGGKYRIAGGSPLYETQEEEFGFLDDKTDAVVAGVFIAGDIELEPAE